MIKEIELEEEIVRNINMRCENWAEEILLFATIMQREGIEIGAILGSVIPKIVIEIGVQALNYDDIKTYINESFQVCLLMWDGFLEFKKSKEHKKSKMN